MYRIEFVGGPRDGETFETQSLARAPRLVRFPKVEPLFDDSEMPLIHRAYVYELVKTRFGQPIYRFKGIEEV